MESIDSQRILQISHFKETGFGVKIVLFLSKSEDVLIYLIGPLKLTVTAPPRETRVLSDGHGPVDLTPKAVRMLEVFARQPGETLTRADLRTAIWPTEHVEDGNINRHVSLVRACLRQYLGEGDHLISISKQGYQLMAPVLIEAEQPAQLPVPHLSLVPSHAASSEEAHDESFRATSVPRRRYATIAGALLAAVILAAVATRTWFRSQSDKASAEQVKATIDTLPLPPLPTNLHPTPENHTRQSLVILDLANNSSSKASDWLGTAIREIVWMDFNASEDLKIVNGQNTIDGEVDLDLPRRVYDDVLFRQIGKRFGADNAITGNYRVDGSKIHVDLELTQIKDGASLGNSSFDTTEAALLPSLATAVNQFRGKLNLPPAVTPAANVLPVERGFASLQPFAEGVRLQRLGFPSQAHPPLVKAAKLSPLSPMAHLELSRNSGKVGMPDLAASEAHFAIQNSNGLPPETKLYVRARVHYYAGLYGDCAQEYRQLIRLRPDDREYKMYLGECYFSGNQPDRELAMVTPFLKLHDFRFDRQAARDYVALHDWENARKYAEAQIRDAREVNAIAAVSNGITTHGNAKAHLDDLPGAMADFKQAIALATPKRLYWELARAYGLLANAQSNTRDLNGMLANTRTMLEIWQRLGEKRNVLYAMERVADAQRTLHDFDGAQKTLLQALDYASSIQNEPYAAEINLNLAQVGIERNDLAGANFYVQAALSKATALGDLETACEAQGLLGDVALGQGDTNSARTDFQQGLDLANQAKQDSLRNKMLKRLMKLETSAGNNEAAARWQSQMTTRTP